MATYLDIQTRVASNIIDLPAAVSGQIGALVQSAHALLQQKHDFKCMEAVTSVFTTATQTRVLGAVPADFRKPRGRPVLIQALGTTVPLEWATNRRQVETLFGTDAGGEADPFTLDGTPKALLINESATSFEVWPYSDGASQYANGQYRIRVPYWKTLSLVNPGDTDFLTANGDRYIEFMATSYGFSKDWDETRAAIWAQLAANELKAVVDADKRYRLAFVDTLVPYHDVKQAKLSV